MGNQRVALPATGGNPIITIAKLLAIAQAEKRSTFVLIRYWVFLGAACLNAIGIYIAHAAAHAAYSSVSATVGFPAPRNILSFIAIFYLGIFITGIVFLAFEIRARDSRAHMLEVLDSRPYSNLDLVLGRFLGLFLCAWVPIVILLLFIQGLGWVLPLLGSPLGGILAPMSLIGFAFYMAVPAIAFCCALAIVITLLVRRRLIALVLSLALIGGLYFVSESQPYAVALTFDLPGTMQVSQQSEWLPSIAKPHWWLQRMGLLFLAGGLLFVAAVVHPRLDGEKRGRQTMMAAVLTSVGVVLVFAAFQSQRNSFDLTDRWRAVHEAKRNAPVPDIVSMRADVEIDPGRELSATVDLIFGAPGNSALASALFSLNPGLEIIKVVDAQGNTLDVSHENGLLEIPLTTALQPGDRTSIRMSFRGKPDLLFGYLDSALDLRELTMTVDRLAVLPLDKAIFEPDYVALMPGIHWLPSSGVDVGRDDGRRRTRDFYTVDLTTRVPSEWTAAGPGLRKENGRSGGQVEYRFAPRAVVSDVALLAAAFERHATELAGITFELLLHPDHRKVLDAIAPSKDAVEQWVTDRLTLLRDAGLEYPYEAFTLVEVPNTLRGYTGGWRMDTALAPSSMVLMKEKGFPTARFDIGFGTNLETLLFGGAENEEEGDPSILMRNRLVRYFSNDFSGGNLGSAFAQSIFAHQTAAAGREAIATQYLLEQLATLVMSGERSYFSVEESIVLDETLDEILDSDDRLHKSITDKVIDSLTSRSAVWDAAGAVPLSDFDPWKNPKITVDVLALRSGALAEIIYDILGPRATGRMLAGVLESHRNSTYTIADVVAAAGAIEPRIGGIIADWFSTAGLAGFSTDQSQLYQLPESSNGERQYQLKTRITNKEPVVGFGRVSWITEVDGQRSYSDPIRIPNGSVEFSIVLAEPPLSVWFDPYLSLNREEFLVASFSTRNIAVKNLPPVNDVQLVDSNSDVDRRIIVDDLDAGFSIVSSEGDQIMRLSGRASDEELDHGLPVTDVIPRRWGRRSVLGAWGQYRHTVALTRSGSGNSKAILSTQVSQAGKWRLEIHLPKLDVAGDLGQWSLTIVNGGERRSVDYDASDGNTGWNVVGEYELSAGKLDVELSDKTTGSAVIADAIAWLPAN